MKTNENACNFNDYFSTKEADELKKCSDEMQLLTRIAVDSLTRESKKREQEKAERYQHV